MTKSKFFVSVVTALLTTQAFASLPKGGGDFESMKKPSTFKVKTLAPSRSRNSQEAAIYGKDDRYFPVSHYPYTAIGRVALNGGTCSGFLVSRCHVVTANHCQGIDNSDPLQFISSDNSNSAIVTLASKHGMQTYLTDSTQDFQFLLLDKSIGDQVGWLGVADVSAGDLQEGWVNYFLGNITRKYSTAGYNGDLDKYKMSVDDNVQLISFFFGAADLILMRADTFNGASGGPLFYYNDKNEPFVVGIDTKATVFQFDGEIYQLPLNDDNRELLAGAVPSRSWYAEMQDFMAKNPCP